MGLYLGNKKQKMKIGNYACCLNFNSVVSITNGITLLSSDNYILKDKNRLCLAVKEVK